MERAHKLTNFPDTLTDRQIEEIIYYLQHLSAIDGKIGTSANQVVIGENGIQLKGTSTIFDDIVAAIAGTEVQGVGVSTNGAEQRIEYLASANLSDYAWTAYQMRHAWKLGSVVQPHIHWEQANANVPNWLMQHRWQINGGSKVTAWTNYKCNTTAFTYTSGTLNQICHGVGLTPPVGYGLSDILQIRILRDTANASALFIGADPYAGTVSVTSNDCHLEQDALGSNTEFTK